MQSLGALHPKSASLAIAHPDSNIFSSLVSRRRKRRNRAFNRYIYSISSIVWKTKGLNLCSGLHSNCFPSYSVNEPKSSSSVKPFALALSLEQEPAGHAQPDEVSEEFSSSGTSNGLESVGEDENSVISEENYGINEAQQSEKEKVDLRGVARNLCNAKTVDDIDELSEDLESLPMRAFSSMIRGFGRDGQLDPAFALVEWLKRKTSNSDGSIRPNLFIYNSLLGALKETEQYHRIDEVMEDMRLQGVVPNIVTYNTLMAVYIERGQPSKALDVLLDIKKNGLLPSPVTYSTALLAYRRMEDANGAIGFFVTLRDEYRKGEIGKDTDEDWEREFVNLEKFTIRICYHVMRMKLVKEDDPAPRVLKLLGDIDRAELNPGRAEYERLVWACTRENHHTVAKELYRRIRETGSEISLSVCNHIIWLMGKAKKWWAALEIYEDLLDKGPEPNNLSYELVVSHFNILLSAARRRGIWRWGVRLLNKMQDKGLRLGTREWNAVLVACSKAAETSAAVQLFRRMVEQGEKPTVLSYGALLSALEKGKLYDEALQVWEHMCKVGVKPNVHAYTILVSVYIGKGRPELVDYLLREMVSSGIQPTVVTFNAIITGCAKNNMSSAALEWFQRMKVSNIIPNDITYEMLIEALAQDGKPRLAYEMYARACNEGLNLSSKSYDAVVRSCQAFGVSVDLNALGPRPIETRKTIKIRKNLSAFCNLADLPRRSKPFEKTELYTTRMQGR